MCFYLTQNACRGSAKLDSYSDTITPLKAHNDPLSEYRAVPLKIKVLNRDENLT